MKILFFLVKKRHQSFLYQKEQNFHHLLILFQMENVKPDQLLQHGTVINGSTPRKVVQYVITMCFS